MKEEYFPIETYVALIICVPLSEPERNTEWPFAWQSNKMRSSEMSICRRGSNETRWEAPQDMKQNSFKYRSGKSPKLLPNHNTTASNTEIMESKSVHARPASGACISWSVMYNGAQCENVSASISPALYNLNGNKTSSSFGLIWSKNDVYSEETRWIILSAENFECSRFGYCMFYRIKFILD